MAFAYAYAHVREVISCNQPTVDTRITAERADDFRKTSMEAQVIFRAKESL